MRVSDRLRQSDWLGGMAPQTPGRMRMRLKGMVYAGLLGLAAPVSVTAAPTGVSLMAEVCLNGIWKRDGWDTSALQLIETKVEAGADVVLVRTIERWETGLEGVDFTTGTMGPIRGCILTFDDDPGLEAFELALSVSAMDWQPVCVAGEDDHGTIYMSMSVARSERQMQIMAVYSKDEHGNWMMMAMEIVSQTDETACDEGN